MIAELEVSPSNRVSRPYEKPLEPCRVDQFAISQCGRWLATVDIRDGSDEGFGLEVYLKLWRWYEAENRWDLNTKIDRPHGNHKLHSIAFCPVAQNETDTLLVSTGGDGHTKTWAIKVQVEKNEDATGQLKLWISKFTTANSPDSFLDSTVLVFIPGPSTHSSHLVSRR